MHKYMSRTSNGHHKSGGNRACQSHAGPCPFEPPSSNSPNRGSGSCARRTSSRWCPCSRPDRRRRGNTRRRAPQVPRATRRGSARTGAARAGRRAPPRRRTTPGPSGQMCRMALPEGQLRDGARAKERADHLFAMWTTFRASYVKIDCIACGEALNTSIVCVVWRPVKLNLCLGRWHPRQ